MGRYMYMSAVVLGGQKSVTEPLKQKFQVLVSPQHRD